MATARGGDRTNDRARMIESYLPLVRSLARRHAGRGESFEDLVQVGALALMGAVDRRDPGREASFPAYAARCVDGELRRHLRDRCATVRVPRRAVEDAAGSPQVATARRPVSLDDADAGLTRAAADDDPDEVAVSRALVAAAAGSLDRRERRVLLLRFVLDLSQAEVGRAVGVSQVHVSRLQRSALDKMRAALGAEPGSAASG